MNNMNTRKGDRLIADISAAKYASINVDWQNAVATMVLTYSYGNVTTVYQLWDRGSVTKLRKAMRAIRNRTALVEEV